MTITAFIIPFEAAHNSLDSEILENHSVHNILDVVAALWHCFWNNPRIITLFSKLPENVRAQEVS